MQRMYERVGTSTIMFHFLWRSQIFTIEPEHVKVTTEAFSCDHAQIGLFIVANPRYGIQ